MRSLLVGSLLVLGGCWSETWVYAPTAEEHVDVPEGTLEIEGLAVLTYASAEIPDEVVGHTLRMSASSSLREDLILEFPEADPGRAFSPGTDADLNLDGVFPDCGQPTCTTAVPFLILREVEAAARIRVEADAILSRPSVVHEVSPESGAATLGLVLDP